MALHQLTEAKVNKQTNNNNTSAKNKQTNKGSAHAGAAWNCAVTEFSAQCVRVCGKASEIHGRALEVSEIHRKRHEGWLQAVL